MRYPKKLEQHADAILSSRRREAIREQEEVQNWLRTTYPAILDCQNKLSRLLARLGIAKIRRSSCGKEIKAQIDATRRDLRDLMSGAQISEDDLLPKYTCPECQDRGYIDGRPCPCRQTILNRLVYEQLCDVSPAQSCSFDNFDLHYYVDHRQDMAKTLKSCERYAKDFSKNSKNLLFYGDPGLGKTHLSLAIAGEVVHSGHLVMYASAPHLMAQLEDAKFRQSEDGLEYKEIIYGCDLLVIDDLGAELVTRYTQSEVYDLINTRLNIGIPTIINTNLTMHGIYKLYTNRVASRIAGAYTEVHFQGRDIRLQKRVEEMEAHEQKTQTSHIRRAATSYPCGKNPQDDGRAAV